MAEIFDLLNADLARLSRAECAEILARCKALEGRLLAHLLSSNSAEVDKGGDRLLGIDEAAKLLAVTKMYLYRNTKRHKLGVKLGDGTLRYSLAGLQEFIRAQRNGA